MDEKVIWNPTCLEMDNVWWSHVFCGESIQIVRLDKKERKDNHVKEKYMT